MQINLNIELDTTVFGDIEEEVTEILHNYFDDGDVLKEVYDELLTLNLEIENMLKTSSYLNHLLAYDFEGDDSPIDQAKLAYLRLVGENVGYIFEVHPHHIVLVG